MLPVAPSVSLQRFAPGTASASHRTVPQARDVAGDGSFMSAARVEARTTESSFVRSAAHDRGIRLGCPVLLEHLGHSTNSAPALPDRQWPVPVSIRVDDSAAVVFFGLSAEDIAYCRRIVAQMPETVSVRRRALRAASGPAAVALKPGMCRVVSAAELRAGIEFGELHGNPFSIYEFVLRFSVDKHDLYVLTAQQFGEFKLTFECGTTSRIAYSASLPVGQQTLSQLFRIGWRSEPGDRVAVARIKGTGTHFAGVRLYLQTF
jgi:hypothetical protein